MNDTVLEFVKGNFDPVYKNDEESLEWFISELSMAVDALSDLEKQFNDMRHDEKLEWLAEHNLLEEGE